MNAHNPDFIETLQLLLVNSGIRALAAIAILTVGWLLATWSSNGWRRA